MQGFLSISTFTQGEESCLCQPKKNTIIEAVSAQKEEHMHEYPITEQLVKIAEEHCNKAEADKVTRINLVVGEYSGFVPESIHMYFDLIAEGTRCEGAEVDITRVKAKLECPACGEIFSRALLSFACPKCGTDGGPTDIGKEFYIESIEVE
jgi:hydrogenase nickel incorporation protein HypA/HybF